MKKNIFRIALLFIVSVSLFYEKILSFFHKTFSELAFLPCPFYALTGLPCPGCGMTRAFLSLGQLEIKEALNYNFLSLPLFVLALYYLILGQKPSFIEKKIFLYPVLLLVFLQWGVKLFL